MKVMITAVNVRVLLAIIGRKCVIYLITDAGDVSEIGNCKNLASLRRSIIAIAFKNCFAINRLVCLPMPAIYFWRTTSD